MWISGTTIYFSIWMIFLSPMSNKIGTMGRAFGENLLIDSFREAPAHPRNFTSFLGCILKENEQVCKKWSHGWFLHEIYTPKSKPERHGFLSWKSSCLSPEVYFFIFQLWSQKTLQIWQENFPRNGKATMSFECSRYSCSFWRPMLKLQMKLVNIGISKP